MNHQNRNCLRHSEQLIRERVEDFIAHPSRDNASWLQVAINDHLELKGMISGFLFSIVSNYKGVRNEDCI